MNNIEIGQRVRAVTTTATAQKVTVLVTAIEEPTADGWLVWGYRINTRRGMNGTRQTTYPRRYFVGRSHA